MYTSTVLPLGNITENETGRVIFLWERDKRVVCQTAVRAVEGNARKGVVSY